MKKRKFNLCLSLLLASGMFFTNMTSVIAEDTITEVEEEATVEETAAIGEAEPAETDLDDPEPVPETAIETSPAITPDEEPVNSQIEDQNRQQETEDQLEEPETTLPPQDASEDPVPAPDPADSPTAAKEQKPVAEDENNTESKAPNHEEGINSEQEDSQEASEDNSHSEEEAEEDVPVTFTQSIGDLTVTAKTTSSVLPENATMTVKLLTEQEDEEAIKTAVDALEEKEVEFDGIQVFDITFTDENGEEIEPKDGAVTVNVEISKSLLEADIDEESIEIHHINEEEGVSAEKVASKEDGKIQEEESSLKTEFEVSSFSSFTITWKTGNTNYAKLTAHYVWSGDGEFNEITQANETIGGTDSETIQVSKYVKEFDRYEYVGAFFRNTNNEDVSFTTINFSYSSNRLSSQHSVTFDSEPIETTYTYNGTINVDIYLVYKLKSNLIPHVAYYENGGSLAAPDAFDTAVGTTFTLPDYSGTKPGYEFIGWSTASSVDSTDYHPVYSPGTSFIVSERDYNFYAVWNQNTYSNATFFIRTDGVIPTNEPGHFDNGDYSKGYVVENAITKHHWIIDSSRIEVKDGQDYATNAVSDSLKAFPILTKIYDKNEKYLATFNPETQYILWYAQKKESDGWHVDGVILDRNNIAVSYDKNCNDKSVLVPSGFGILQGTTTTAGYGNKNGPLEDPPTRWGYEFKGWNTKPDGTGDAYFHGQKTAVLTENTTFWAQWELKVEGLVVKKLVQGNMGEKNKSFDFEVKIWDLDGKPYSKAKNSSGVAEVSSGTYQFVLKNGESANLEVPLGGTYQISEGEYSDYEQSYRIGTDGQTVNGRTTEKTEMKDDITVIFINEKNVIPPSGVDENSHRSNWTMIVLGLGLLLILILGYKYRRFANE